MNSFKKVYMVYQDDEDGEMLNIIGFFDTEDKADTEAYRLNEESGTEDYYYYDFEVK